MDFGKLSNVDRVDFRLPPPIASQDERSLSVLRRRAPGAPKPADAVRTGCPVWAEKRWIGKIYPLGTQPSEFLHHYSRQFGTIELNVTHYNIPKPETIAEWRAQTPEGFRFCPKWPQEISHHRMLGGMLQHSDALIDSFCESLSGLGDRLGTSWIQLPPAFSPQALPTLKRFLARVPRGFPVCVEFRHEAWFKDHALIPEALDALEAAGAGTVISDVAGRRDVAHVSLTAPRVLIRFVGNELHPTDDERIDAWVPRLKLWIDHGIESLDFCIHQPDNVTEPELIRHFIERMNRDAGTRMTQWALTDQGTQMSLDLQR